MAKQREVLRKIVALKRQSAEQHLRAVQMEVDRIVSDIAQLNADLHALDEARAGFDALRLAEEHGHVRKLIADIRAAEAQLKSLPKRLVVCRQTKTGLSFGRVNGTIINTTRTR